MSVADRNSITQEQEVERNYEAFQAKLDHYMKEHEGKFALMHNRRVVEFFDTDSDACTAGTLIFGDLSNGGRFSVQEVTRKVIIMRPGLYALEA